MHIKNKSFKNLHSSSFCKLRSCKDRLSIDDFISFAFWQADRAKRVKIFSRFSRFYRFVNIDLNNYRNYIIEHTRYENYLLETTRELHCFLRTHIII